MIWQHIKHLVSPGTSLGQQVVRGAMWVYILQILTQGFRLLRTFILARLLAPEAFGVVAIALLATDMLDLLSQTGFNEALIQRKDLDREYLDTAWTVAIIRGGLLCGLLFLVAPAISNFYNVPAAIPVIRIVGISLLARGLNNIGVIFLRKELRFTHYFIYEISAMLADFFVTIPLALLFRNEWALVGGIVAKFLTRLLVSYLLHAYRPHFLLNQTKARELYRFGVWIFLSAFLSLLAWQGDSLVLPKILDVTALGLYTMAVTIARLPLLVIRGTGRVLFPAFSKLQDDLPTLRVYCLRSMRLISFVSIPMCIGIFMLAEALVHLLGGKWTPIVPVIKILTFSTLIGSVGSFGGLVFKAVGKPHLFFIMLAIRTSVMAIAIYPLTIWTGWGMSGTAVAVVLSACIEYPVIVFGLKNSVGIRLGDWIDMLLAPSIAAIAMVIAVQSFGLAVNQFRLIGLGSSILLGISVYCGGIFIIRSFFQYPVFDDIQCILKSLLYKDMEKSQSLLTKTVNYS